MATIRLPPEAQSLRFRVKDLTLHCYQLSVKHQRFGSPADAILIKRLVTDIVICPCRIREKKGS